MIDARTAKLSDCSYPITKSSNWAAVIGYPRDRATITQQIGARRTNHELAFCSRYDCSLNCTPLNALTITYWKSPSRSTSSRQLVNPFTPDSLDFQNIQTG